MESDWRQVLSDGGGRRERGRAPAPAPTSAPAPASASALEGPWPERTLPVGRSPVAVVDASCDLDTSPLAVQRFLRAHPRDLGLLGAAAEGCGQRLLMRLGAARPTLRAVELVSVDLGPPLRAAPSLDLPLHWHTKGGGDRFPVVDGNLGIAPAGHGSSRLSLHVAYKPPADRTGRDLHPSVLDRVATTTVRAFLWGLAVAMEHQGTPRRFEHRPQGA